MVFAYGIVSVHVREELFPGARVGFRDRDLTVWSVDNLLHLVHEYVVLLFDFCQPFLLHKMGLALDDFALLLRDKDNFVTLI